jgi:Domain of unknown function (DUF4412)
VNNLSVAFSLFAAATRRQFLHMKILYSLLSLLMLAAAASADFVVVQKVDGLGQQSGNITVKIKDGKARAELAPQISQLIDGNSGDTITLMHGQKSFMKIPASQTKALLEQMQKVRGGDAATPPSKPVATGTKEKVAEWDAEIFTWAGGALTAKYWVAKEFPNYQAIQAAMDKLQSGGVTSLAKNLMPASSDFPGMIVKTEIKMKDKTVTSTIVSVKEEAVDPKEFEVPADYKELPAPSFSAPTEK